MPTLIYTDEAGERATFEMLPGIRVATVGRNPECSITTSNPSVSRNHSEIRVHGPYVVIKDQGSSNGTFVNDAEVKKPVVLQPGDLIKCGDFEIEFHDDEAPRGRPRPRTGEPREDTSSRAAAGNGAGRPPAAVAVPPPAAAPPEPVAPVARARPRRDLPDRPEPVVPAPEAAVPIPEPSPMERGARPPRPTRDDRPLRRGPALGGGASSPVLGALDADADAGALQARVAELEALLTRYETEGGPSGMKARLDELSNELTRREAINQTLEEQQSQLQVDLRQQDKLIGELENRLERRDMEIENHLEKQKELREQLAHQAEQVQDLRRDVNGRDHEIEDLAYKLEEAQRSVDEGRGKVDARSLEIQEYKAELSQKSRLIEELQKQLDIMAYDLKAAQAELVDVSQTSTESSGEVSNLERKVRHLREIVTDKEAIIEDMRARLAEKEEEVGLLREEGGGGGLEAAERALFEGRIEELEAEVGELRSAGRAGATTEKLNDLKRANRDLRRRVDELEGLVSGTGGAPAPAAAAPPAGDERRVKTLERDLAELQEENELLQQRVAKMRKGGADEASAGGDGAATTALKRENRELRRRIRELEDAGGAAGRPGGGDDGALGAVLDDVNAAVSAWASDFEAAAFSAAELKRLVEMLGRIDTAGLEPRDRRKLESIVRDVEPQETLGNLEDTLHQCLERAKDMKTRLKDARRRMMD